MRNIFLFISIMITILLTACASTHLNSPCTDWGAHCHKIPINTWYNRQ